jgi:ATP-binding cassette subfamily B (MDR/TAP) protein 1
MTLQSACLETAASHMALSLKTEWFRALLRQDLAFHDLTAVSGTASSISASANKYKLGVGRKLGGGFQFTITVLGGIIYAYWASWQASLLVLAVLPLMSLSAATLTKVTQS